RLTALVVFIDTAPSHLSTLSLHDALPICARHAFRRSRLAVRVLRQGDRGSRERARAAARAALLRRRRDGAHAAVRHEAVDLRQQDRKSTRLNSSHVKISYAVFCLKKKNRH